MIRIVVTPITYVFIIVDLSIEIVNYWYSKAIENYFIT